MVLIQNTKKSPMMTGDSELFFDNLMRGLLSCLFDI
ncbi:Uncharacterised protein [Chryseobacterium nakagawai]|nr:Uncharacterised protein [Chryseobacterium nakagawai]